MRYLDLTLPTSVENLALDEALLLEAEAGSSSEVLRVWEWPSPVVILGAGGKLHEDVDEEACERDGVPILRRSSGGGTVLWGSGCLVYSLVLRYEYEPILHELQPSYRFILGRVLEAVDVPGAVQAGISDLAFSGYKFSGNAQQRKRDHLLHHGTLLYGMDLSLVSRYLRQPVRQPEYRENREHTSFIRNLDIPAPTLKERLRQVWQAEESGQEYPAERVRQLVAERHGQREWIYRR
jgi:lipoate---protein ligase